MNIFLKKFADNGDENSLSTRMRKERSRLFWENIEGLTEPIRILDVGGTFSWWKKNIEIPDKDFQITLLNLPGTGTPKELPDFIQITHGDARNLSQYAENSFDVVFSNSVIEHVGNLRDQQAMANEIRRVGKTYFVQTPNRYFPLEPHFLFPFWQFLPISLRAIILRLFNVGWVRKQPTLFDAHIQVEEIRLLTFNELTRLFPAAKIHREKIFGLTKSFMVISQ